MITFTSRIIWLTAITQITPVVNYRWIEQLINCNHQSQDQINDEEPASTPIINHKMLIELKI